MSSRKILLCMLSLGLLLSANSARSMAESPANVAPSVAAVVDRCDFRSTMRKLWEDHITWTRLFIISDVANLPDKATTTQRLLRNQQELGAAIAPYYGQQAGNQLTALLRQHILLSAQVLDAAKARDNNRLNIAKAQWYANADTIASFLSSANPRYWPLGAVKQMMHEHLRLTTNEALDYLHGSYAASIADYDQVHSEILMMADALSSGIMLQFPRSFR